MVSAGDEHNFGDLLDKTIDATGDLERNTSIYSLGLLPIKKIGRRPKKPARHNSLLPLLSTNFQQGGRFVPRDSID